MKKSILIFVFAMISSLLFGEQIIFSAASMSGSTSKSGVTKLKGNAYIRTDSMEILADQIELSGEDYTDIKASGNIAGKNFDSNMEFKCDSMKYNRDSKIALLEGDVSLVDSQNDVNASAQIIEYNQDTDIAVLQIEVKLTQKKNICTGTYAVYQKKQQLLELSGNAQVKQDKDTFRAQMITLNLDTQEISLTGNVKGSVTDTGKKEAAEKKEETENKKETENKENAGGSEIEPAVKEGE